MKLHHLTLIASSFAILTSCSETSETADKLEKELNDVKEVVNDAVEEKADELSTQASEAMESAEKSVDESLNSIEKAAEDAKAATEKKTKEMSNELEKESGKLRTEAADAIRPN